jgi:hypothetical protein
MLMSQKEWPNHFKRQAQAFGRKGFLCLSFSRSEPIRVTLSGKILKQRGTHATRLTTFLANKGKVLNSRHEQATRKHFLATAAKVVTKDL